MIAGALLSLFAAVVLAVIFLALVSRANRLDDEDAPKTITPPAYDEPLGDQVDVRGILNRYAED